jgi:hypothetical protein
MQQEPIEQLQHIRQVMERSSRMISLSGLSGVGAGICALIGAIAANNYINQFMASLDSDYIHESVLEQQLLLTAVVTLAAALATALFFTWRKSKADGLPLWGMASKRLVGNTLLPMIVGVVVCGVFMMRHNFIYVAPCLLIFYGLGLVQGSKYTVGEVRYLGYILLVLGCTNLFFPNYSLPLWALGFGVAHIVYGILMWLRYEKK